MLLSRLGLALFPGSPSSMRNYTHDVTIYPRVEKHFSALGSKVMRIIISCEGGRAWERG